jgi:hypothetical protein
LQLIGHSFGRFTRKPALENRASLLGRVVRYELPIEDTLALLRAYGWDSDEEIVILTAADAVRLLERYLGGELTARQVEHWAELLEMRDDIGFEERWAAELRRLLFLLANPEINETITPSLAIRLRRLLVGEAA